MIALQILSDDVIISILCTLTVSLVGSLSAVVIWVFNNLKKDLKTEIGESKTVITKFVDVLTKKLEQTDERVNGIDKMIAIHGEKLKIKK